MRGKGEEERADEPPKVWDGDDRKGGRRMSEGRVEGTS